ncbi:prepilin-type N-terminal cleavage/methylation domain-containing protein [Myxococcaceae bacterium JPH2]|nr:prepilin-type N-terminal cleavage/methylation domain-containing protein [Myxococcaceae bacterium JPH2]
MSHRLHSRGFSLIELLIASAIAIALISAAISVGLQLQRRGVLEERTMETQNAARAARDLFAFGVQRAGAGAGSSPLAIGNTPASRPDLRYPVWVTTQADFATDPSFALPSGPYQDLRSDVLRIWETDPGNMLRLVACQSGTFAWTGGRLCTQTRPPEGLKNLLVAVVAPHGAGGKRPIACVGMLGSTFDQTINPPLDSEYSVDFSPGVPGLPALASTHECGAPPVASGVDGGGGVPLQLWDAPDLYVMPITARDFRVNWKGGAPALEMDSDGFIPDSGFTVVSRDIERLQVFLGVVPTDNSDAGVLLFPDAVAGRPALDTCTFSSCSPFITWDAGTLVSADEGPDTPRDKLMQRVRLVELRITARSERLDRLADLATDGGLDDDGNIQDGYKRRHSVIRLSPRNFGYAGQ